MRCTQNPTVGEEWRRGWHPENIAPKSSDRTVLVVGGGPAGLEAARALGQRGYRVTLAEAGKTWGGRVSQESRLPGLNAWARVRDWRLARLKEMANVDLFLDSRVDAAQVLEFGFAHVLLATGATWRRDGVGVTNHAPIPLEQGAKLYGPEDVFAGSEIAGPVVVFDDDNFYLGALLAEALRARGLEVTLLTTESVVSAWTANTLEQHRIHAGVLERGIRVICSHNLVRVAAGEVEAACVYSERRQEIAAQAVVMATSRRPNEELYVALTADRDGLEAAGIRSLQKIGDCDVPSTIAAAVHDGHRAARELETPPADPDLPFRREHIALDMEAF